MNNDHRVICLTAAPRIVPYSVRTELEKLLDQPDRAFVQAAQRMCVLVRYSFGYWSGRPHVRHASVIKDGETITEDVSAPRWNLLPKDARQTFSAISKQLTEILGHYSRRPSATEEEENDQTLSAEQQNKARVAIDKTLHARAVRVILQEKWPECRAKLQQLADIFNLAIHKFTEPASYENMLNDLKERHPDSFEEIRQLIPGREDLGSGYVVPGRGRIGSKFHLTWRRLPVAMPSSSFASEDEEADEARLVEVAAALENMITAICEPRWRLSDAARNFLSQIAVADNDNMLVELAARGYLTRASRRLKTSSITAFKRELIDSTSFDSTLHEELKQRRQDVLQDVLISDGEFDSAQAWNSSSNDEVIRQTIAPIVNMLIEADSVPGMLETVAQLGGGV